MARFRGTVSGGSSEASRLGHVNTGLDTTCNGWDCGVTVSADAEGQYIDCFAVRLTGGSNSDGPGRVLADIRHDSRTGEVSVIVNAGAATAIVNGPAALLVPDTK